MADPSDISRHEKFEPKDHTDNLLEAFDEFVSSFVYTYAAISREPPEKFTPVQKGAWVEQNKRKIFLGKFSSRNLQKEYEEATVEEERDYLSFSEMTAKLRARFKLRSNTTLANYKFRKLKQNSDESFDLFIIRVKHEAKACNFSCNDGDCTVSSTMCRDQIIFGTKDDDIRRHALHEEWDLETLTKKGRSLEAASNNADKIKLKSEDTFDVYRMKPKRYSRKYQQKQRTPTTGSRDQAAPKRRCYTCSSSNCPGKRQCPGYKVTCFSCNQRGHYRGAKACKKSQSASRARRLAEYTSGDSSTEHDHSDTPYGSSTEYYTDDGKSEDEQRSSRKKIHRNRVVNEGRVKRLVNRDSSDTESSSTDGQRYRKERPKERTQTRTSRHIKRIQGVRKAKQHTKHKNKRYETEVVIMGNQVTVFCDTGADVCVMSYKNAQQMGLPLEESKMQIRPYGSKAKKCKGKFIGTVMFGDAVTNTTIYIIDKDVETLLSGRVCEQLGIITFREDIRNVKAEEPEKVKLLHTFPSIFNGVGLLKGHKVKFYIDENVRPVCQQARPIPFHLREKLNRELEKMEVEGIIEEHHGPSPWVSNVVLAPKDDGNVRVTIDMREPNQAILPNRFPIMRPEEIKSQLADYEIFSKLDFKSAFHQLSLEKESRMLTVFHAGNRLMRYTRLTMGATPASGELSTALRPLFLESKDIHVIHDDLIVAGRNREEHDKNLHQACQTIEKSGMTLNLDKCIIGKKEIPWWGMKITNKGLKPDPEKVRALQHATPPSNKDEVRSFLCMIQSNKDFIPNLARKTTHLRRLTKKHIKFVWSQECQKEFEILRLEFKEDTLLRHYNQNKPTYIFVDAHITGVSAILSQGDGMENAKPVAFASRATTPIESRYPQLDIEALAIDFALRRFRMHLVGAPETIIVTDHKPLEAIFRNRRLGSTRTERIKLRHQDIKYKVVWRDGKSNPADYMSRHATPSQHLPREIREEAQEFEKLVWFVNFGPYTEAVSMNKIIEHTKEDQTLKKLGSAIKKGYISRCDKELSGYRKVLDELTRSDDGLLLKGEKIILPASLVKRALQKAHQGGHPGMSCMKRRLRSHFWFPKMDKQVEEYVSQCKDCTIFTNKTTQNPLQPHTTKQHAWENLSIDLFGPMPDQRHVLVVTDNMSRFPAAKIVPNTSATPVLKALEKIYSNYGQPITHRTDNGPPFDSEAFKQFSAQHGVTHIRTYPYHPQANPAECFMRPLGKGMKIAHHNKTDKEHALDQLLSSYRATPHPATGEAPGDIMLRGGYKANFPSKRALTDGDIDKAKDKDHELKRDRTEKINKSIHRKEEEFEIGTQVYTKNNKRTKFQPLFDPTPRTITTIEKCGIICTDGKGTIQRRHIDDVKQAIPNAANSPQATEETNEQPADNTSEAEIPVVDNSCASNNTRPTRNRKPPARYRDTAFETMVATN